MFINFTLTKLIYRVFKFLSFSHNELFLLYIIDSLKSILLIFYMNNIFNDFEIFKKQFVFLRDQFFS